jgi:hypothetical protein
MQWSPTETLAAESAWPGRLAVATVLALAVAGSVLAARTALERHTRAPAPPAGIAGVGDAVRTSFGALSVGYVQALAPPHVHGLGGPNTGLGLPRAGRVAVEAQVTVTTLSAVPVAYSPDDFRLRAGRRLLAPTHASIPRGTLQPHAAIETLVDFTVPANARRLVLAFRASPQARPVLVDLGSTGRSAPTHAHHH